MLNPKKSYISHLFSLALIFSLESHPPQSRTTYAIRIDYIFMDSLSQSCLQIFQNRPFRTEMISVMYAYSVNSIPALFKL